MAIGSFLEFYLSITYLIQVSRQDACFYFVKFIHILLTPEISSLLSLDAR